MRPDVVSLLNRQNNGQCRQPVAAASASDAIHAQDRIDQEQRAAHDGELHEDKTRRAKEGECSREQCLGGPFVIRPGEIARKRVRVAGRQHTIAKNVQTKPDMTP